MDQLGTIIQNVRKRQGLTAGGMAGYLNLPVEIVAKIEQNKRIPSEREWLLISKFLEIEEYNEHYINTRFRTYGGRKMELNTLITQKRLELKMSRHTLAHKCGVSQQWIHQIEMGKFPGIPLWRQISTVLGLDEFRDQVEEYLRERSFELSIKRESK